MKVWAVLLAVVAIIAAGPVTAGEVEDTADHFAETVSNTEGLHCVANHGSRTIICLAMLNDQDTDRTALFLITSARSLNLPLVGWSLMLANPNDYVVSMNF